MLREQVRLLLPLEGSPNSQISIFQFHVEVQLPMDVPGYDELHAPKTIHYTPVQVVT